ncbi:ABC transporter permease subunit [Methylobacterium frigidaeris]|uniref:Glycine betaine uptake system permease protein YehY n=1 Tax=Methylobacterium frigidaeris TaxID=2038277 RepID=A0AA37HBI3_9HYPH|nr:ABC transporter permease subunit [Methylobacterium frigidaeris]PIK69980.1 ABC transporter permease [Methylobacterium frigidaeris]GJD62524.1 Glycine betaine uptake system permease protein YehY [Methylobacterium frigidaeris]
MTSLTRPAAWLPLAAAGLAVAALAGLPFLTLAPNRLVPGAPVGCGLPGAAAGALAAGAAVLLAGQARSWRARAALAAALIAWCVLLVGLGHGAAGLLAGQKPAARAVLGSGAWLALLAMAGLAGEAARAILPRRGGLAATLLLLGLTVLIAWAGLLDSLSLAVEYRARADAVAAAVMQHLGLSGASLLLALALSVPLALLRLRDGPAARLVDGLVSGIQVVPALALFAALVAGLSGLLALVPALRSLGLAAIGPVPAVIGTAAYLALPLVSGLAAGLAAADPDVLAAARAIGLTPREVLLRVRLPLGAPVLMGALRVAAVQSVGLATLGGLVGAGGLGALVFEGMAQFAQDLILLGALPVIGLALAVDAGLALLAGTGEQPA